MEDEEEAEIEEEEDSGPGQVDDSVGVAATKEVGDGDGLPPEEIAEGEGEEGKKENEPFAVPTAGAFYMHDDRFRESSGGRHRYIIHCSLLVFLGRECCTCSCTI